MAQRWWPFVGLASNVFGTIQIRSTQCEPFMPGAHRPCYPPYLPVDRLDHSAGQAVGLQGDYAPSAHPIPTLRTFCISDDHRHQLEPPSDFQEPFFLHSKKLELMGITLFNGSWQQVFPHVTELALDIKQYFASTTTWTLLGS